MIIDIDQFRKKKEKAQQKEPQVQSQKEPKSQIEGDLFHREAMKFKFQNMKPQAMFVQMNVDQMPPSYPPYNGPPQPPMAA